MRFATLAMLLIALFFAASAPRRCAKTHNAQPLLMGKLLGRRQRRFFV